jgi:DNA polymerase III alpha subunit
METEKNIDEYGRYIADSEHAFQLLLDGKKIDGIYYCVDDQEFKQYTKHMRQVLGHSNVHVLDEKVSFDDFHAEKIEQWMIPEEYKRINMKAHLLEKCTSKTERDRVETEYALFERCGLETILNVIMYFVDTMKKNSVVIGVGRGSSSSVFILYLLGLHMVNSIEHKLDFYDFFKEE